MMDDEMAMPWPRVNDPNPEDLELAWRRMISDNLRRPGLERSRAAEKVEAAMHEREGGR
jgi:hypothetical protein